MIKNYKLFLENKEWDIYDNESIIEFDIPIKQWLIEYLPNLGIEYVSLKPLAEGGYGFTVDLGNNTIIKLTSDKVEVKYANLLKDIDSPNLVKVYDVFIIDYKGNYYYLIHLEKLNTNIQPLIKTVFYYLHKKNPIVSLLEVKGYVNDNEVLSFFKGKILYNDETILFVFNKWLNVWKECKKYNLPICDLHERNIGVRNNEFVYFDISDMYEINPDLQNIKIIKL